MFSRRARGEGLGVILLLSQLFSFGVNRIPNVTFVAIVAQIVIFMGFVPQLDPHRHTCMFFSYNIVVVFLRWVSLSLFWGYSLWPYILATTPNFPPYFCFYALVMGMLAPRLCGLQKVPFRAPKITRFADIYA